MKTEATPSRRIKFSIANLLLVTAVVALSIVWLRDHLELRRTRAQFEVQRTETLRLRKALHRRKSRLRHRTRSSPRRLTNSA